MAVSAFAEYNLQGACRSLRRQSVTPIISVVMILYFCPQNSLFHTVLLKDVRKAHKSRWRSDRCIVPECTANRNKWPWNLNGLVWLASS